MKDLKQGDKIEVQWIDAYGMGGWWNTDDIFKQLKDTYVFSCGYYVGKNKNWLIVSINHDKNPAFKEWGQFEAIPLLNIIKIKKL